MDSKSQKPRSSGQQGPSPPKSGKNNSQAKRSSRRSRRRRGRGRQQSGNMENHPSSRGGRTVYAAPAALSAPAPVQFFKQVGTPRHKEWGIGSRFAGTSVIGVIGTSIGGTQVFFPYFNQRVGSVANDVYAVNSNLNGFCFTTHPSQMNRLWRETYNWGRYCYRKLRLHTSAVAPTTVTTGYVAGLSHNVSLPFNSSWVSGVSTSEVLSLQKATTGAFYQSFSLESDAFKGDRTWACDQPTIYIDAGTGDSSYNGTTYGAICEDYYQYFFVMGGTSTEVLPGSSYGFVFLSYEIDFYEPRSTVSSTMNPMRWALFDTLNTPSSSSSATSSSLGSQSTSDKGEVSVSGKSYSRVLGTKTVLRQPKLDSSPMLEIGRRSILRLGEIKETPDVKLSVRSASKERESKRKTRSCDLKLRLSNLLDELDDLTSSQTDGEPKDSLKEALNKTAQPLGFSEVEAQRSQLTRPEVGDSD